MRAQLPRYFIATWADVQAVVSGTYDQVKAPIGEWHAWHPTEDKSVRPLNEVSFIIMRDPTGTPHPHWRELPHVLDPVLVKTALAPPSGQTERRASYKSANQQTGVPITSSDTMFSLLQKLQTKMGVFLP